MTNKRNTSIQAISAATNTAPTPVNAVTGKDYFGEKATLLQEVAQMQHFPTHEWATMKQWNRAKETIAKRAKGTLVLFYDQPQDGETEAQTRRVFLFNRCQLEGYKPS